VELLVVAVSTVLVGADTFVEIELWARERLDLAAPLSGASQRDCVP